MDPRIQPIVQRDWPNESTRNVLRFPTRVFSTPWMITAMTTAPTHVHGLALKRPHPYRIASPTDSAVLPGPMAEADRPSGRSSLLLIAPFPIPTWAQQQVLGPPLVPVTPACGRSLRT